MKEWTLDFEASNGVPFRAVIRNGPHQPHMSADNSSPTISFYDRRHEFGPNGQFTGGHYYLDTFLEHGAHGLDLDGGVENWRLGQASVVLVRHWVYNVARVLENA